MPSTAPLQVMYWAMHQRLSDRRDSGEATGRHYVGERGVAGCKVTVIDNAGERPLRPRTPDLLWRVPATKRNLGNPAKKRGWRESPRKIAGWPYRRGSACASPKQRPGFPVWLRLSPSTRSDWAQSRLAGEARPIRQLWLKLLGSAT
jgi:hypothetical protein